MYYRGSNSGLSGVRPQVSDVRRCQTPRRQNHMPSLRNVKGFFGFLIISMSYLFVDRGTFSVSRRKPPWGGLTSDTSDTCKLRRNDRPKPTRTTLPRVVKALGE